MWLRKWSYFALKTQNFEKSYIIKLFLKQISRDTFQYFDISPILVADRAFYVLVKSAKFASCFTKFDTNINFNRLRKYKKIVLKVKIRKNLFNKSF